MTFEHCGLDPVAVTAVAQLAVELVDEVSAVGQDQHAAGPRGLDEPQRGDGLARSGGVLEPEPLGRVWILGLLFELALLVLALPVLRLLVLGLRLVEVDRVCVLVAVLVAVLVLLVVIVGDAVACRQGARGRRPAVPGARRVAVARGRAVGGRRTVEAALVLGQQRRQRSRQGVYLVGGENRSVGQARLVIGEQALEPKQQREPTAPIHRRDLVARFDLGQRSVERLAAG